MDNLIAELRRLHFIPDPSPDLAACLAGSTSPDFDPVGADGLVAAPAIEFARAADWDAAAELCRGAVEDLELPAPAVSVAGGGGYRIWFPLTRPVALEAAGAFLEGLRRRYLAELAPGRLRLLPAPGASAGSRRIGLVPALDPAAGKWSAFIDPAMGAMFVDDPGLGMAPNPERQAELLAGIAGVSPAAFDAALARLATPAAAATLIAPPAPLAGSGFGAERRFPDPASFLLAVMNDPAVAMRDRIRAARALLPHFSRGSGE